VRQTLDKRTSRRVSHCCAARGYCWYSGIVVRYAHLALSAVKVRSIYESIELLLQIYVSC